ncbi:unnamed protein product [Bemisia tabaci]|uniref:Uncharacterized protein n=1 Tax=Bemisia tabaci TaxID=7038 RepID=A0A9P0AHH0_BEMTA|nr:unnamed protein product [Bemisia tabaci]
MVNQSIEKNILELKMGTHHLEDLIQRLHANNVLDTETVNSLAAARNDECKIDQLYEHLLLTPDDMTPLIFTSFAETRNSHLQAIVEAHETVELVGDLPVHYHETDKDARKAFHHNKKNKKNIDTVDSSPMLKASSTVRLARERLDLNPPRPWQAYKMGSKPKGYALIINIQKFPNFPDENRAGSEVDLRRLQKLFTELGYEVETHVDLKGHEILQVVEKFAKEEKHAAVDSCLVFIMSHGDTREEGKYMEIQGSDKISVSSLRLINCFVYPQSTVFGTDKPILFFFQACRMTKEASRSLADMIICCCKQEPNTYIFVKRGQSKDFGQPIQSSGNVLRKMKLSTTDSMHQRGGSEAPETVPEKGRKYDHMLIVNACVPGYVSIRYIESGAWFVDCLVRVFQEHAWEFDIDTMLSMVDSKIRGIVSDQHGMQTTTIEKWGFTKKFYFNPGLYDEEGTLNGFTVEFASPVGDVAEGSKGDDVGDGMDEAAARLSDIAIAMPPSESPNERQWHSTPL